MRVDLVFYRCVRAVLLGFARVFFRLRVEGLENVPPGPFVLAPVHRSNLDFLLVSSVTTRRMRYMGKDSIWKVKPLGQVVSALGAFPVQRGRADREALRRCIEFVQGGEPVVIFPEGTRQSGLVVEELFEGAAYVASRTQVPLVPVGIGGSEAAMPKGSKLIRPVRIRVVVGKPLDPAALKDGGRVSRREVHDLTQRLHADLQSLFTRAQATSRQ